MIIKQSIQLTTDPLEKLLQNGETIDFRLDEPVWNNLNTGDKIEFWEDFSGWDKYPSEKSRRAIVKIVEIFRAATFSDLIDNLPASFTKEGQSKDILIKDLRQWWTPEKEQQTGVLGWKVELLQH